MGAGEVTPYQDSLTGQEAAGLEVGCPEGLESSKAAAFPLPSISPFLSACITRDGSILQNSSTSHPAPVR